jgi:hypothetical protein
MLFNVMKMWVANLGFLARLCVFLCLRDGFDYRTETRSFRLLERRDNCDKIAGEARRVLSQ